jgi:hypothetical protein
MNRYRGPEGDERVWFDDDEIELMMEDELRRANLTPTPVASVVDVEAFIEDHLKASLDQYADLDGVVLGLTEFRTGHAPAVRINKDLTGSALDSDWCPPGIHGRWRATLAHEAAHIVLHRMLFEVDPNQSTLFGEEAGGRDGELLRCLKRDVAYRGTTRDWREVQANRGMAALLMPKRVFVKAARKAGIGSTPATIDAAARELAQKFGVSRQATTIRLRTVGLIREDTTDSLFAMPN